MSNDKIDTTTGMRRMSALEALRKQAENRPKQEDPAVVRARMIEVTHELPLSHLSFQVAIPRLGAHDGSAFLRS